jgi:hypothetical protein
MLFFSQHILWSLLVLIVVFNITVTVIMDAYAAAKETEDAKVQLYRDLHDQKHVQSRLNTERWKNAKKRTVKEMQQSMVIFSLLCPILFLLLTDL